MSQSTRFKKQLKQNVDLDSKIYLYAKSVYRIYCNFAGPLHVLPDFLIIGAARSGTTSLYQYLVQHPNIEPCVVKQLHFFDQYFQRGTNWYRMNFPSSWNKFCATKIKKNKFITGEATPYYLQNPNTPKKVFELIPDVKLIALLRNPVDRAYSHFKRRKKNLSEKLSFEEATEQEEMRIKGEMKKMEDAAGYFSYTYHRLSYIHAGLYVEHLERWLKVFPRKQLLIVQTEEFQKNIPEIYNRILEFLEMPSFQLKEYKQFQKSEPPSMDLQTRKRLLDYCKPYNKKLFSLIGTRFDWDA